MNDPEQTSLLASQRQHPLCKLSYSAKFTPHQIFWEKKNHACGARFEGREEGGGGVAGKRLSFLEEWEERRSLKRWRQTNLSTQKTIHAMMSLQFFFHPTHTQLLFPSVPFFHLEEKVNRQLWNLHLPEPSRAGQHLEPIKTTTKRLFCLDVFVLHAWQRPVG